MGVRNHGIAEPEWYLTKKNVAENLFASIQKKINSRPRQKLKFETPKAEFFKRIA